MSIKDSTDGSFKQNVVKGFEGNFTKRISKGSVIDISSSIDELIARVDELEREHEAFIVRPPESVKIYFETTDLREVIQKSNNSVVKLIKGRPSSSRNV